MLRPCLLQAGRGPLVSPGKGRVGTVFKLLSSPHATSVPRGGLLSCFLVYSIVCGPLCQADPRFRTSCVGFCSRRLCSPNPGGVQ